jgi:acetyl-CoA acetyltransferase
MTAVRALEDVVISGYAELPVVKDTLRSTRSLLAEAVVGALRDADLTVKDVDGFALGSFTLPPDRPINAAATLGLSLDWHAPQEPGGSSGISAVLAAARAVEAGDAEVVVCAAADVLPTRRLRDMVALFNTEARDWLAPIGFGGANGVFALLQARHMHQYGTTREQLGVISVVQRRHGALNPSALFRTPVTLDQYLNSRPVVEPLHLLDCVHSGCGASAVVVTTKERARVLDRPAVTLLAGAEFHNYRRDGKGLDLGWQVFAEDLYEAAQAGPEEFDAVEFYDDYPIMVCRQFEELGFCAVGMGGEFLEQKDMGFDGELPLNTGGGMLACGQAGAVAGYVPLIEAIRQLRGEATGRQVPEAKRILVSGLGMFSYTHALSVSAAVLGSED